MNMRFVSSYPCRNMITSANNPKIKEIKQLQKKARLRQEKGLFLVEGIRMVRETPKERILEVYVSETFRREHSEWLERWGVPCEILEDRLFESVCDTKTPQGILCLVKRQEWTLDGMLQQENPLFLLIENLQDPGNLGTIFRTGEAAGVSGIIMSRETVDIYNPKTVRSTMGAIYRVHFFYTDSLEETIKRLKASDICIYAAHLKGEKFYSGFSYDKGTAFLIGNEGNGLSDSIAGQADEYLKIPMEGQAESLNAAVAAAILMYEAHRQRNSGKN